MSDKQPKDHEVFRAMRIYGGSFMQTLARAAEYADSQNLERIKAAWPEEWLKYSEMARAKKKEKL